MEHPTTESKFNTALHSFTVYKDCFRIFWDQWQDSGILQKKFVDDVIVPDLEDMPSNSKIFNYEELNKATCYIQELTGTTFNPSYKTSNYKIGDVLKDVRPAILLKFKKYNEALGYEL